MGASNTVTGANSGAFGTGNTVNGNGSFAIGDPNTVTGDNSHAFGNNNTINANSAIAIGNGNNVAHDNAMAIGNNVTTVRKDQIALGNASNTYTLAGVTSSASKAAQGAPTHIVTSNAAGDLAAFTASELGLASTSDLSAINNRLDQIGRKNDEQDAGIALAMATQNPDLTGNETFGIAANWGSYEGANALGVALAGVLAKNFLVANDRVAFSGGVGIGFDNGGGDSVVGGRVGLQWTH